MKKVLVVEDDRVLLSLISGEIKTAGFEVLEAVNGKEGLEVALKEHPDLILADILMPVMDGMEMTTKLRDDEWGRKVEIIVLTNLNSEKNVADFLEKGAYSYMIKSDWSMEDIVKKVKETLDKKG